MNKYIVENAINFTAAELHLIQYYVQIDPQTDQVLYVVCLFRNE